jgi:hypothetical protein
VSVVVLAFVAGFTLPARIVSRELLLAVSGVAATTDRRVL